MEEFVLAKEGWRHLGCKSRRRRQAGLRPCLYLWEVS